MCMVDTVLCFCLVEMGEFVTDAETADRHQRAYDLLWGRGQRPSRGPKPSLTLERVVAAATAVADAEGLGAVSMQRVAADLGVTKMAMYRYVPGKSELVMLMIDAAIGEPPDFDDVGDWRQRLGGWGRRLWQGFTEHPWLVAATVGRRPMGPCELAWMDSGVAALTGIGLTGPERLDTIVLLTGHVRSLAQQALPVTPASVPLTETELLHQITTTLEQRTDRYPALRDAVAEPPADADALEFGMERILDGIAALVERRAERALRIHSAYSVSWPVRVSPTQGAEQNAQPQP